MAPGLPSFFTTLEPPPGLTGKSPQEQLDGFEAAARGGGADQWILYGAALQRVGKPVSARAAFDRALELAPDRAWTPRLPPRSGVSTRTTLRPPSPVWGRWHATTRTPRSSASTSASLLLWIRDVQDARAQLEKAAATMPVSLYSREAKSLLSRLEGIGT